MRHHVRFGLFAIAWFLSSITTFAAVQFQNSARMLVSTSSLAEAIHNPSLVVLQISRDRASYDRGHIPGAKLILLSQIAVSRDGNDNELPSVESLKTVFESVGVKNNSRIVLYDDAQGLLAARAYFTLDYLGLAAKAALLDGGIEQWAAESRALDRNIPQAVRGHIKPHAHPEIVIEYPRMRELSMQATDPTRGVVLIDARSPQQFSTVVPASIKGGSGHIPGAHNVFWRDALQDGTVPLFKPLGVVRDAYTNAGVRQNATIAIYCNSGIQAAHAYFTLKLLGYRAALYDGSFQDWVRHPDAPVE